MFPLKSKLFLEHMTLHMTLFKTTKSRLKHARPIGGASFVATRNKMRQYSTRILLLPFNLQRTLSNYVLLPPLVAMMKSSEVGYHRDTEIIVFASFHSGTWLQEYVVPESQNAVFVWMTGQIDQIVLRIGLALSAFLVKPFLLHRWFSVMTDLIYHLYPISQN